MSHSVTLSDYIKRLQLIEKQFKSNAELKPYAKDKDNRSEKPIKI